MLSETDKHWAQELSSTYTFLNDMNEGRTAFGEIINSLNTSDSEIKNSKMSVAPSLKTSEEGKDNSDKENNDTSRRLSIVSKKLYKSKDVDTKRPLKIFDLFQEVFRQLSSEVKKDIQDRLKLKLSGHNVIDEFKDGACYKYHLGNEEQDKFDYLLEDVFSS